jgi:hypothetical protein
VTCLFGHTNKSARKIFIDLATSQAMFRSSLSGEENASVDSVNQWGRLTVTVEGPNLKIYAFYDLAKDTERPYGSAVIINKKTGVSYHQNTACYKPTDYLD